MGSEHKPIVGVGTIIEAGKYRWQVSRICRDGVEFKELKRGGRAQPMTMKLAFGAVEGIVGMATKEAAA